MLYGSRAEHSQMVNYYFENYEDKMLKPAHELDFADIAATTGSAPWLLQGDVNMEPGRLGELGRPLLARGRALQRGHKTWVRMLESQWPVNAVRFRSVFCLSSRLCHVAV